MKQEEKKNVTVALKVERDCLVASTWRTIVIGIAFVIIGGVCPDNSSSEWWMGSTYFPSWCWGFLSENC